jgi:hypothetical protein
MCPWSKTHVSMTIYLNISTTLVELLTLNLTKKEKRGQSLKKEKKNYNLKGTFRSMQASHMS